MKTKTLLFLSLFLIGLVQACDNGSSENTQEPYGNPPAEGFNLEGSDPEAIEVADQVMEAMGGREAWDNTRHIAWNFFGSRDLVWDKWTGDVRIDMRNTTFLIRCSSGVHFTNDFT